jgi:REG-2-like HAD superfamily hydrolase
MSKNHPNFGRTSMDYVSWWTNVVQNVLRDASHSKINPQDFIKVADRLIDIYETNEVWGKFERASELVKAIKKDGKIVGVISNFDPRLPTILRKMGLTDFDFVINSYEARCEKPDRKIFNLALERATGFQIGLIYPSEALHIGNELDKDYEAAREAGWSSILINGEQKNSEAEQCFKDMQELWIKINYEELNL